MHTFFYPCSNDHQKLFSRLLLALLGLQLSLSVIMSASAQPKVDPLSTHHQGSQREAHSSKTPTGPPEDISQIPLPKARGFWGTFFFWSGGVLCMYLVGRQVFKEQSHERQTLKRLRDELGHFFPEFDPVNIQKWVTIAAPHLYHGRREGDFSSMESFTTEDFRLAQSAESERLTKTGQRRVTHLDKIINVHTLGASWEKDQARQVEHPPLGVELTLRVEAKAIDFVESEEGELISGKKKPNQFQLIWRLVHNGKTWTLVEVYEATGDITHLSERPPLPPIADWRRPADTGSKT